MSVWIRTSDRLPLKGERVLVVYRIGQQMPGLSSFVGQVGIGARGSIRADDEWGIVGLPDDGTFGHAIHVTHWMPLPDLPDF